MFSAQRMISLLDLCKKLYNVLDEGQGKERKENEGQGCKLN